MEHLVSFSSSAEAGSPIERVINVTHGLTLADAARQAGIELGQPCGGQGRCGRCAVKVLSGQVHRRSTLRLSSEDVAQGYALACQTTIQGDIHLYVPPQEKIERRLTSDRTVAEVVVPPGYDYQWSQTLRRVGIRMEPPTMDDQTDDLSRLRTALRQEAGFTNMVIPLPVLQKMSTVLRAGDWNVTAILDVQEVAGGGALQELLVDLIPGLVPSWTPLWGAAIDIGTTTVTVWLVDLVTGQVRAQAAEYNGQIARGEDVISRIVYASKNGGGTELQELVLDTIKRILERACQRVQGVDVRPEDIVKAVIVGNSTMIHLLLRIPTASIRLAPYVTSCNWVPLLSAAEIGLSINPLGIVDCLPGVASYVGSDITSGVFSSGMDDTARVTLFLDVGTNGEIVLGSRDWLVTCACSAGPAFEGAGVRCGMRAILGAIEEVWINADTCEPSYRVIGGGKPRGLCGSGLISLIAEMFMTGIIDKAGNLNEHLDTPRIRPGENGLEYVIAWANETAIGEDVLISRVDIDNFLRAKGAIYAGYSVLAGSVGVPLELVEQVLIGGSFGKYINVEKAIQIGLLPDLPWDRFQFLGNTAVRGAYYALLDHRARDRILDIASRMTYVELSADNSFYDAFMSALFLPHTDLARFPSVPTNLDRRGLGISGQ